MILKEFVNRNSQPLEDEISMILSAIVLGLAAIFFRYTINQNCIRYNK